MNAQPMAIRDMAMTAPAAAEDAFAGLVERQSRFVYRVAYAIVRNVHDAEDVTQETFLRIFRAKAWTVMEDERAFLARTAWRLAVNRLPRRRTTEVDENLRAAANDPEESAIASDRRRMVERLIDGLPEELRQTLALSAMEELNSPQIAAAMGVPEGTVRTRIMRARRLLKEKLEGLLEGGHAR